MRVMPGCAHMHAHVHAGALPSSLATNPHLGKLDVAYNRLSGLPSEWVSGWDGVLNSSLVTLRLSSNSFGGPFRRGWPRRRTLWPCLPTPTASGAALHPLIFP